MSTSLFEGLNTPHQTYPFDLIKVEDYKPAFLKGFELHNKEIEQIVADKETPTFSNTIETFERSGAFLSSVQSVFYNLLEAESSPEMHELAEEMSPIETDHYTNIYMNDGLFERVKYVDLHKDEFKLNKEQLTLLDKVMTAFVNRGANLKGEAKEKFKELSRKSAALQLKYGQNLLNATNAYTLSITKEEDLEGLPKSAIEAAQIRAKEKDKEGYLFDLSAPSYISFMKYAKNRALRKELYLAYNTKANGGEFDNRDIVRELVNVRLEMAQILGFKDYASYVLEHRMAKSKEGVYNLLNELLAATKDFAKKEVAEIENMAKEENGDDFELMPWDWSFYSEILKEKKYSVNDEAIRPYFELENVKKGVFGLAHTLYGLEFKKNDAIPVYNKEVEAYEVLDADGSFLSVLYVDFHPRATKQGGAWMTEFKCQHRDENGVNIRPHISIVMNLTKPTETNPSLLSIDEVQTFLHEFGHAIHEMVANTTYESVAGTNVYRDFVELPSQIMENWATEKEFLDGFAKHYKTHEAIPEELILKIKASDNYHAGYAMMRQLSFGYLDMAWHSIVTPLESTVSVKKFESEAWRESQILPEVDETLMSSQFSHIFDGGYAAGYYSYKWAEVLDADAFSVFKEEGLFNKETARRFRTEILEKGGSENPMDLYIAFRGKYPTVDALLKRAGIK